MKAFRNLQLLLLLITLASVAVGLSYCHAFINPMTLTGRADTRCYGYATDGGVGGRRRGLPKLAPSDLEAFKSSLSIVDVINQHVDLRQHGTSWIGCCPFHNDKSPSFSVSEEKGLYHCFACHASGDVIKFTKEFNGMTFQEALKQLSELSGVPAPISFNENSETATKKAR